MDDEQFIVCVHVGAFISQVYVFRWLVKPFLPESRELLNAPRPIHVHAN
jgi:hypothetical protein